MWEFYGILCFLDHGWYVLGMRDEWPFTRVSGSLSYPPFPSLVIWLSFIVLIWVDHHSFHFLIAFFCISPPLSRSSFHILSIPYILIHISDSIPSSHHSHVSLMVWPLILSFVSPSTFPLVTFRFMAHEIFSMHYILYTRVWVWWLGIWA